MKLQETIKSNGFWAIIIIGLLLILTPKMMGWINNWKFHLYVGISSLIFLIVYIIIRGNKEMDKPLFFVKKWQS